jgi:hypothetical protein
MGWLADRIGPAIVLAVGFTLWSVSTAATGLVLGSGVAHHPAPADGGRRSDVLPQRPEPAGAQRSADPARPRDRDHAVRRRARPGPRDLDRRHDHAELRLAGHVRGDGLAVAGVAVVLAPPPARRARRADGQPAVVAGAVERDGRRQPQLRRHPAPACALGRHARHVLLELRVLLRVLVAAAVPRQGSWPDTRDDDVCHDGVLRGGWREHPAGRLHARSLGTPWRELQPRLQDRACAQLRGRGSVPDRQHGRDRPRRGHGTDLAHGRDGRLQQPRRTRP